MEPDYLLEARSEQFRVGLQPSLPVRQAIFWTAGQNVLFHEDAIQTLPGFEPLLTDKIEDANVLGMSAVTIDGRPTLLWGTANNLYRFNRDQGTDLVGSGFTTPKRWVMEPFGQWMIATNNNDRIQIFKEENLQFEILEGTDVGPTPFTKCLLVARNRAFQFCINTDYDHRGIHWSKRDDPYTWDSFVHATAGYVPCREADSELNALVQLDQELIVASNYSVHAVNFIQSPYMYGTIKLLDGVGAVGPHAMVTANRLIFSFGYDFIWSSNGVKYEPISSPAVTRFIYGNLNMDALHMVEAWHLASRSAVLWYYPSSGSAINDRLAGFNYKTGAWTIWGFGSSAVEDNLVFPRPLFANSQGDILYLNFEKEQIGAIGVPLQMRPVTHTIGSGFGRWFGLYFGGRMTDAG